MTEWQTPALGALLSPYGPILLALGLSIFLGLFLLALSWVRGVQRPDASKLSPYECGFEPIGDLLAKFDVRFYVVAVLFILFDVEVVFLFPWALAFQEIGWVGYVSMMVFLGMLVLGFLYEWRKGALEWE